MDEKKSASSWDDLIQEIGASPAADALERKRPVIETEFTPPPASAEPPPRPKPSDWNALAGELGIEGVEPPPPPLSKPASSTPPSAAKPPRELAEPEASPGEVEAGLAGIDAIEDEFEEVVEEEIADVEFSDAGDSDMEGEVDDDALRGEAARNAFEALFQAGSFGAMPPREPEPPEIREPRSTPANKALPRRDPETPRDAVFDDMEDDAGRTGDRDEPHGDVERQEGGKGKQEDDQPRRRRRRRRGRGRDRAVQEEAGAQRADDDSALESEGETPDAEASESEERSSRRRPRRRSRRASGSKEAAEPRVAARNGRSLRDDEQDIDEDGATDADDFSADDDELPSGAAARRPSHKSIPSWSEAIGVMVETNMQARKNSPSRPSSSRERGRGGRGRGRGGRGRGGS